MKARWMLLILTALVVAVAVGCGEEAETEGATQEAQETKELSLSIDQPADGASVTIPFDLRYSTSVPLGAPETGKHHVHIWYDGNDDEYEVVNANSYSVTELPSGEHKITVSLRNADHSAAGADENVTVKVTGGGDTGGGGGEEDPGYEY